MHGLVVISWCVSSYLLNGSLLRKCVSKFSLVLLLLLGYCVTVSRHCVIVVL